MLKGGSVLLLVSAPFVFPFFLAVSALFQMSYVGGLDRGDTGEGLLDDTVFIQGLPETVTEELLAKHFADAGIIKVLHRYLTMFSIDFLNVDGCILLVSIFILNSPEKIKLQTGHIKINCQES